MSNTKDDSKDNEYSHREAHRLFWMVKGHLTTSEATVMSCANSYFNRLWRDGCDGAPVSDYEEGFEEAYQKVLDNQNKKQYNKRINLKIGNNSE